MNLLHRASVPIYISTRQHRSHSEDANLAQQYAHGACELCLASMAIQVANFVRHTSKLEHMSQKAGAKAPVLPGDTVAMPVPPHPPAKAARARALAKEWGPTRKTGAARTRSPARNKRVQLVPACCPAPSSVL